MKFNEIKQSDWLQLQLYLDTCLLPLSGLNGTETPDEMTRSLEELRDLMTPIETNFKGRIVTLPAVQYFINEQDLFVAHVDEIARRCKRQNYRFIIAISANETLKKLKFSEVDLFIVDPNFEDIYQQLSQLWRKQE
jgi:23S rRNA (pseudouridine1915-N3)-methyltransferase